MAKQLTLDANGHKSTDLGFDANNITQFGMDFQWTDGRRMASTFGGGTFVAADGMTAQIPAAYRAAWNWYYDAIWSSHFAPNGNEMCSQLLNNCMTIASGRVAMETAWPWIIPSFGSPDNAAFGHWDMAVMPSYNGVTSSPMDANTFSIAKASAHPDEAYQAMLAIMADPTLIADDGGMPAKTADQAAYFAAQDAQLALTFPDNDPVHWSVLQEMARHPAVPSHEADMPDFNQIVNDYTSFYNRLQNNPGLDINVEINGLQTLIQAELTGHHIGGTVTGPDGQAVANVNVAADSDALHIHAQAYTGSDGTYSMAVPAGDYTISFRDNNGAHRAASRPT